MWFTWSSNVIGAPAPRAAFRATHRGNELRWRMPQEVGVLAFTIVRSGGGRATHPGTVSARGALGGSTYRLLDRTARRGVRYVYALHPVDGAGRTLGRAAARRV
jgi:hypothetical protein